MSSLAIEIPPTDWISRYWQWIYSFYQGNSPLESGSISCQSCGGDNFLCFPCTGGGKDCNRSVTLRGDNAKRDILIPVFAAAYNAAELGETLSHDQLLERARDDVLDPESLKLTVDKVPLTDLKDYYVESLPFKVKVPDNQAKGKEDDTRYITLSAGYWCRLRPLSPGVHSVRFGGKGRNKFETLVEYKINVEKKNSL